MATIPLHQLFEALSKETKFKKRVELLKRHDHTAFRTILQGCFDPRIKFLLPEGDIPYEKAEDTPDNKRAVFGYIKSMIMYIEGGKPMPQARREDHFISMMQTIHPEDAEIIESMVKKQSPGRNITAKLVRTAYPGLIPPEEK